MGGNGQYDDRFSRSDCRAIRRTMRRVQRINPKVLSAVLLQNGEAEVVTGNDDDRIWWRLRQTENGWKIVIKLRRELQTHLGGRSRSQNDSHQQAGRMNDDSLINRWPLTFVGVSGGLFYGLLLGVLVVGPDAPLTLIGWLLVGLAIGSGVGAWLDLP